MSFERLVRARVEEDNAGVAREGRGDSRVHDALDMP